MKNHPPQFFKNTPTPPPQKKNRWKEEVGEGLPVSVALAEKGPGLAAHPRLSLESAHSKQEGKTHWLAGKGGGEGKLSPRHEKARVFRARRTHLSDLTRGRVGRSGGHNKWACKAPVSRVTGNWRVPSISVYPSPSATPTWPYYTRIKQIQNH